jgi:hypothetical protein
MYESLLYQDFLTGSMDDKLLSKYSEVLSTSSQSRQSESTRLAALHSLSNFSPVLQLAFQAPSKQYPVLPAICALLTLLSDDDHEIRTLASKLTATILNKQMISTPMGSEENLAKAIIETFDYDSIEQNIIPIICQANIPEALTSPLDSRDNLFAKERENVWRDEIYELELYLDILSQSCRRLQGGEKLPHSRLVQFARDGVNLIQALPEKYKKSPVGWDWDNDVCEMIMKISLILEHTGYSGLLVC